ncbi:uncharacterized protein LTR77_010965 [Saxophila tyrrhenica]|uniref:Uncharacterized protein n=1 Tax=Saxophila tyrrhenica TaxID=1690608 RepID=A0AAV9NXU7_9PEZI|nr:hypothetical protein LTR77_010965 [Saxophila tyrrhenica]
MAPPRAPLAKSESKVRFFERLSLDERYEQHRLVYATMKREAVRGRERLAAKTESLAPQFQDDPTVEPPYSSSQISETAIHRQILSIYAEARPETKVIYDLGRDTAGTEEDNWVIRWMLWHVFRYRDKRNKNRQPAWVGDELDFDGNMAPDDSSGASRSGEASKLLSIAEDANGSTLSLGLVLPRSTDAWTRSIAKGYACIDDRQPTSTRWYTERTLVAAGGLEDLSCAHLMNVTIFMSALNVSQGLSKPRLEEQHAALDESLFGSVIGPLSDLFVRHRAHLDYGISLPHRHQTLPPKHVMVHRQDHTGRDICRPESLPTSHAGICPRSYYLHEGRFMPFGYSSTHIPEPPPAFLLELGEFLRANSLDNILAVRSVTAEDSLWLETMSPDLSGTISVRRSGEQALPAGIHCD